MYVSHCLWYVRIQVDLAWYNHTVPYVTNDPGTKGRLDLVLAFCTPSPFQQTWCSNESGKQTQIYIHMQNFTNERIFLKKKSEQKMLMPRADFEESTYIILYTMLGVGKGALGAQRGNHENICDFGRHWLQCHESWTLKTWFPGSPSPRVNGINGSVAGREAGCAVPVDIKQSLRGGGRIPAGLGEAGSCQDWMGKEHHEGSSGCNCTSPGSRLMNCNWIYVNGGVCYPASKRGWRWSSMIGIPIRQKGFEHCSSSWCGIWCWCSVELFKVV